MRVSAAAAVPRADPAWRVGIVASSYYKEEIDGLVAGARGVLEAAGVPASQIAVYEAPGSFEVPLLGEALARSGAVDALIGFGIIVQGETKHADLLAAEVARGIMDVQLRHALPFAFEVLWVADRAQARARCVGPGNKGEEAAAAVLKSLAELGEIHARSIE